MEKHTAIMQFRMLISCSPLEAIDVLVPDEGYVSRTGIAYGPAPRLKLDIYRPDQPDPTKPVVVFLYGGSWKNGERGLYRFVGQAFASRGLEAWLLSAGLVWAACVGREDVGAAETTPLPQAHAHNDYEHARPLFDALERVWCRKLARLV